MSTLLEYSPDLKSADGCVDNVFEMLSDAGAGGFVGAPHRRASAATLTLGGRQAVPAFLEASGQREPVGPQAASPPRPSGGHGGDARSSADDARRRLLGVLADLLIDLVLLLGSINMWGRSSPSAPIAGRLVAPGSTGLWRRQN